MVSHVEVSVVTREGDVAFKRGDRVVVTGKHPWATYAGEIVGPWPTREGGYLVAMDNGINIRAEEGQLRGQ